MANAHAHLFGMFERMGVFMPRAKGKRGMQLSASPRQTIQVGAANDAECGRSLIEAQADWITRRYRQSAALAVVIASMAFDNGRRS
jgi:hypothetical protein